MEPSNFFLNTLKFENKKVLSLLVDADMIYNMHHSVTSC